MKTKKCSKCQEEKALSEFHKTKTCKDGFYCYCKVCRKSKNIKDKEELAKLDRKKCSDCNKTKDISEFYKQKDGFLGVRGDCKECIKAYQLKNKEHIAKITKEYRDNHKEEISEVNRKQHIKNKIANNKRHKKYYQDNKEQEKQRSKDYREVSKNKTRLAKLHTIYTRERRQNDPSFRLLCNLRNRMCVVISKGQKSLSTMFLIGCEIDYLMYHLQEQFKPEMTWDNYGLWHIDHIKPCSKFNLSSFDEQKECFNFTNLQPLWKIDNLRKGSKIIQENS